MTLKKIKGFELMGLCVNLYRLLNDDGLGIVWSVVSTSTRRAHTFGKYSLADLNFEACIAEIRSRVGYPA